VEFYERALDALARLPASADTARLGIDIRLALRGPLWRAGELARLAQLFSEAEALAPRHGITERRDAVYSFPAQSHWAKGEQEQALAYGQRCIETGERRGGLGLQVTGHHDFLWARYSMGQYAAAAERARRLIDMLEGPAATEHLGLSGLPYRGAWSLTQLGDPVGALALVERGERVARRADDKAARAALEAAHAIAVELGVVPLARRCAETLGALG
jgi:tetratricopeptide (TPR) repeat protein